MEYQIETVKARSRSRDQCGHESAQETVVDYGASIGLCKSITLVAKYGFSLYARWENNRWRNYRTDGTHALFLPLSVT